MIMTVMNAGVSLNHAYPVRTGSSDFAGFDDERKPFQQVKNAEI